MLVACLSWACGGKKNGGIAELTKADGPVERQPGVGAWEGASVGAKFYLGDAARTADGAAQITLTGAQVLEMQPHTVLRFGAGKNNATNVIVELGAIDVINASSRRPRDRQRQGRARRQGPDHREQTSSC